MTKILLVEDDPLMSRMYMRVLKYEGFDVDFAENGEDGVAKAKSFKPDLILLDVMMSKMDGFKALEEIKADLNTKDIPVVMLTNLAGEQDQESALKKGAIKYLIKSNYKPKEVVQIVNDLLHKK